MGATDDVVHGVKGGDVLDVGHDCRRRSARPTRKVRNCAHLLVGELVRRRLVAALHLEPTLPAMIEIADGAEQGVVGHRAVDLLRERAAGRAVTRDERDPAESPSAVRTCMSWQSNGSRIAVALQLRPHLRVQLLRRVGGVLEDGLKSVTRVGLHEHLAVGVRVDDEGRRAPRVSASGPADWSAAGQAVAPATRPLPGSGTGQSTSTVA